PPAITPPEEPESGGDEEVPEEPLTEEEEEEPFLPAERMMLVNSAMGRCADIPADRGEEKAAILPNVCDSDRIQQRWDLDVRFPGQGPGGASLFVIVHSNSGLCMDPPGLGAVQAGTQISQYRCVPRLNDNQLWWLEPREDEDHVYRIRNYASNHLCLSPDLRDTQRYDLRFTVQQCNDEFQWWRIHAGES
ncbi:hydrogenase expression protein, partial [Streptomyces alkaliphilus]